MGISGEWAKAIDDYLAHLRAADTAASTVKARRDQLRHLARRVEAGPWLLTHDELVGYLGAQQWARETRRSRLACFVGFYNWAKERRRVKVKPTKGLPAISPSDPSPRPVPDAIYLEALIRAGADEALWIDLAAEHGLRRAEIALVHSRDIVPTLLGHDLVVHGKGRKDRVVPLTAAMSRALLARGPGFLFPGEIDGHISPEWLGKRVNRLLAGAWTIHKLRHRAATRFWIASEGDAYAVADLMGWANLAMVRVYVQLPDERKRRIVESASRAGAPLVRESLTPNSRKLEVA